MRKLGFFLRKINPSLSPQKISGIILPLITPINADNTIDSIALKNIVARMLNKGVQSFFVFSRFSEYENLSRDERLKVLKIVSGELNGKGVLIAGCFANNSDEVIEKINEAQKFASFCVVNVPQDSIDSQLGFADFFESLVSRTRSKILLYNNPVLFGSSIPIEWLSNFINWESFAGIIDASRNPDYFEELSKYVQLVKLVEENEEFAFDALRKGFAGLSCISSILFPAYYLQLVEDFEGLDYRKLMRNEAKVSALNKLIIPQKRIQAIKYVLYLQGLIQEYHFTSLEALSEKEKSIIESAFNIGKKSPAAQSKADNLN